MLSLYTKTPNGDNDKHYFYADNEPFVTWLGQPYCTLADVSFDITNGIVRIDPNGTFISKSTAYNTATRPLYNVTYLMHTQQDGEQRFYHVMSIEYVSNMYILYVTMDMWASYIAKANASLVVSKSNVALGRYTLEPIQRYIPTLRTIDKTILQNALFDSTNYDNELCLVMATLTHMGTNSVFADNALYATKLIGAPLSNFSTTASGVSGAKAWQAALTCGTFTNTQQKSGDTWSNHEDVTVTKAWLLPKKFLTFTPSSYRLYGEKVLLNNLSLFYPSSKSILVDFNSLRTADFCIKDYFVGTLEKSIKLNRDSDAKVEVRVIVDDANIEVHFISGANDVDVTEIFSLPFTANDGNLTTLDKIKSIIGATAGIGNAVGSAIEGNYLGAVTGAASTITGLFNEGSGRYVNGGNAISTFLGTDTNYFVVYDIKLGNYALLSQSDEIGIANDNGAYFGHIETTLDEIVATNTFVGGIATAPHKFVQTSSEIITGVPYDAAKEIARVFRNGVKLVYLS